MIVEKTLHTLELDRVLERLGTYTSFSLGRERVAALTPWTELHAVMDAQHRVAEAWRVLDSRTELSLGGARDIRSAVGRAALGGVLDAAQLLDVQGTLECSDRLRQGLSRLLVEEYPWLTSVRARLGSYRDLITVIAQSVNAQAEILDSASPTLGRVRGELRVAHQRLLDRLQSILSSQAYRTAIQEPIITIRNGRYVIPVRSDARGILRGAVHDTSSSGATLYVEPFQTNDLNNRWRELQLKEQEEIERILREISAMLARQAPSILDSVEALGDLDLALACARFATATRATIPSLRDDGSLNLVQARHPLLQGNVVPISVRLGEDFKQLLVTGPNTGGKTVALKTVGLLTLMAQCGLAIPCETGSSISVFDGIFADIGDEQSIEQSLSTFSSHLTNIIRILREMPPNSLLLLDELGAGTDPAEGSALARSLLTYLLRTPARVMATTHYSELKAFASGTAGVENANVEFDVETLTPTYRLSIGTPGRSNALSIAARLGLNEEIIQGSRVFISSEQERVEALLAKIAEDSENATTLFEAASVANDAAARLRRRLELEVDSIVREREAIMRAVRAEAEANIDDLRRELDRAEADLRLNGAPATEAISRVRERVERTAASQAANLTAPARPANPEVAQIHARSGNGALAVGDRVTLLRTGQEGVVVVIPQGRGDVEVQIGPFKTRAKPAELRFLGHALEPEPDSRFAGGSTFQRGDGPAPSVDFDLRGWRVDEVLPELERYIDDAYMSNMPFVRIIHGKGTGALRQVVREELATNPLVSGFASADAREGGDGVTVAQLAV